MFKLMACVLLYPGSKGTNMPISINRLLLLTLILFIVVESFSVASAKTVMVFAPHPDDEVLMTAGVIRNALQNGDTVKVVVVTNGDYTGVSDGYARLRESVSGLTLLGMDDQDIIFLGYGDASLTNIYNATSETTILTSNAGQTKTYGDQGLGGIDYHSYLYGIQGDYNKQTLFSDIQAAITNYSPDEIYVTSLYDNHADHRTTYLFVIESLVRLKRQGVNLSPLVREFLVHAPCEYCDPTSHWPAPFTPTELFSKPPFLDLTPLRWNEIESVIVPIEMQSANENDNLKYQTISRYVSQATQWLFTFVKRNEFYWERDFKNLAFNASVTVSSESSETGQLGTSAVDGIVDGYPGDFRKEWATLGQTGGAWIRLSWGQVQEVSQVRLYDRPNLGENIIAGTLSFSDGSTFPVGTLSNNGAGYTVTFPPKLVTSVSFRVDSARGRNIGLAEMEVFGPSSKAPANIAPQITGGPIATPSSISDIDTTVLSLSSSDADGDSLSYRWTVNGGKIIGAGPSVSFYPPLVTQNTVFQAVVSVSDGRGGSVNSSVQITVTPSGASNLAPSSTVSVSSQNASTAQIGIKAIDEIIDGYPQDYTKEWATMGELAGASITLNWAKPQEIIQVRLYDRPNDEDHVLSGTLLFSDGSTLPVGSLPNDGIGRSISFPRKFVTSVTFRMDNAVGRNIGLAEMQVFGFSSNSAPQITSGPTASPSLINDLQTSNLFVQATDADGDPIVYSWTTSGGSIDGTGQSVLFNPPQINTETVFTVTVTARDNQGGSAHQQTFITVTPSFLTNVALNATVSVSSENPSTSQLGSNAIDGVIDGYPGDYTKEWATLGELTGASITLQWSSPRELSTIKLYDRPNLNDHTLAGTLLFSDGSTLSVGSLPNNGQELIVSFDPKSVTSVTFRIDSAIGNNIGLAEIEAYGN